MMRLLDLAGRTAVVTGSSAGIGAAVSNALRIQGCSVIGLDIHHPPLNTPSASSSSSSSPSNLTSTNHSTHPSTSTLLPYPSYGKYTHIHCDVRNAQSIDQALSSFQSLDYIVNVVGIDPKFSLKEGGTDEWAKIIDTNLRSQYLVIRAALTALEQGQGKSIVNISSINSRLGVPRRTLYTISKAGIQGLTRGLARELGAKNIRINTITPGWVFTDIQKKEYFNTEQGDKYYNYLKEVQSLPHKQIQPEDIANHVLFCLSNVSSSMTGSNMVVDAGWTLE